MSKCPSSAARRAGAFLLFCGLVLSLAVRCGATAIVEFPIPSYATEPEGIALGPDGALWFTEFRIGQIGRIDTNGILTEYPIPAPNCNPVSIVTGPDSNLWFTEYSRNKVGRIGTNGVIQEFSLPPNVIGRGITLGPDGRLWLLDFGVQNYVPGTPTNGGVIALTISNSAVVGTNYFNTGFTSNSYPYNMTVGSDGNLYFTETFIGRIGRITTNGVITEAVLPATNCQPYDIVTGPDGALWFTEYASNKVGRIDTSLNTNLLREYALPTNAFGSFLNTPYGLVLGPDSNLWYTDSRSSAIGRIMLSGTGTNTAINVTTFFTPTTNSSPTKLAVGADGGIWFGEFAYFLTGLPDRIGKFLFPVPLNIQLVTNSQVVLSWTTNVGTNFALQSNTNLTTMNWMFLTNVPAVVGTNFTVTNPASGSNLFYRLID